MTIEISKVCFQTHKVRRNPRKPTDDVKNPSDRKGEVQLGSTA